MFKKIKLFYLVMILLNVGIIGLFSVTSVSAEIAPLKFVPQVTIPGSSFEAGGTTTLTENNTSYIANYIKAIYNYALSIVGILATIVLMIGGYVWAMSGGDASKITQAKEMITGSIVGLLILLASVTLLGKLNPALVNFKITDVTNISTMEYGCCVAKANSKVILAPDTTDICKAGTFNKNSQPNYTTNVCEETGCCIVSVVTAIVVGGPDYSTKQCLDTRKSTCENTESWKMIKFDANKSCQKEDNKVCNSYASTSCKGLRLGDKCTNWHGAPGKLPCSCYDGIPYIGKGKLKEPCGDRYNDRCYDKSKQTSDCPAEYSREHGWGGRSCTTGLACCHPNKSK